MRTWLTAVNFTAVVFKQQEYLLLLRRLVCTKAGIFTAVERFFDFKSSKFYRVL